MTDGALHMFQIADTDIVVARSASDAWDVLTETTGTTPGDLPDEDWWQWEDDSKLKVSSEDEPVQAGYPSNVGWTHRGPNDWVSERTCAEWAALCGRGYFGGHD